VRTVLNHVKQTLIAKREFQRSQSLESWRSLLTFFNTRRARWSFWDLASWEDQEVILDKFRSKLLMQILQELSTCHLTPVERFVWDTWKTISSLLINAKESEESSFHRRLRTIYFNQTFKCNISSWKLRKYYKEVGITKLKPSFQFHSSILRSEKLKDQKKFVVELLYHMVAEDDCIFIDESCINLWDNNFVRTWMDRKNKINIQLAP